MQNENVDRPYTSTKKVKDLRRPDRRTPMKALVAKSFRFVASLWDALWDACHRNKYVGQTARPGHSASFNNNNKKICLSITTLGDKSHLLHQGLHPQEDALNLNNEYGRKLAIFTMAGAMIPGRADWSIEYLKRGKNVR